MNTYRPVTACPVKVTGPAALVVRPSVVAPFGAVPELSLPTSIRACVPAAGPNVTVTAETVTCLPMSRTRPVPSYRLPKWGDRWYESVYQSVVVLRSIASGACTRLSPPLGPGPNAAALSGRRTFSGGAEW